MTQDEIIEMANKAYAIDDGKPLHPSALFHLEIFAKLVAQHEREACIVDIQMHIPRSGRQTSEYQMAMRMIERIRARGEQ